MWASMWGLAVWLCTKACWEGSVQLTASSSAVHVEHTCSLGARCIIWSSMFVSSISVYVCACMCCNQCVHSYISWRLPMLKPSPVSTPCTGSSKAMSTAKDQRCRGSMVMTCIFVNLQGCWLPCIPGVAGLQHVRTSGLQHPMNSSLSMQQGFDCLSCRPGLW